MTIVGVALALLTALLVLIPAPLWAAHDGTCHDGFSGGGPSRGNGWRGDLRARMFLPSGGGPLSNMMVTGDVHIHIDSFGIAEAHGVAVFRTDVGTEVFIANPDDTSASCADQNDNGVAGFTGAAVGFTNVLSGERVVATFVPAEEIEENETVPITIVFGNVTLSGVARLRFVTFFDKKDP